MAGDAVLIAPVSGSNSLQTGNLTGILAAKPPFPENDIERTRNFSGLSPRIP
jgi:hypothetical protein